eukprot:COSAG02_NODE_346_length_24113_cov_13.213001_14_plen_105_part_00
MVGESTPRSTAKPNSSNDCLCAGSMLAIETSDCRCAKTRADGPADLGSRPATLRASESRGAAPRVAVTRARPAPAPALARARGHATRHTPRIPGFAGKLVGNSS